MLGARRAAKLVTEARARRPAPPSPRELRTAAVTSGGFLVAASLFAASGWDRPFRPLLALALVVTFACLTQIAIETASGFAVPTQLAFVPMLFLLPLQLVPLAVCAGYVLGGLIHAARGRAHLLRTTSLVGCSWFSLPPALVLAAAGSPPAHWGRWPVLAAAFAAQCAGDALHSVVHERLAHGVRPAQILPALPSIYTIDLTLSAVAFLAAGRGAYGFLALLPLTYLLGSLAGERRIRHNAEIEAVELAEEARTDPLTGLHNRRAFDDELARLMDGEGELVLCLLDLDEFKGYNDTYGHGAGDELLREAARAWTAELRDGDVLARLGGDEFALLLPGCSDVEAEAIADRLAAATPRVGCSLGLAHRRSGEHPRVLVKRADRALYRAKDTAHAALALR